jgi:hypothetical protein
LLIPLFSPINVLDRNENTIVPFIFPFPVPGWGVGRNEVRPEGGAKGNVPAVNKCPESGPPLYLGLQWEKNIKNKKKGLAFSENP